MKKDSVAREILPLTHSGIKSGHSFQHLMVPRLSSDLVLKCPESTHISKTPMRIGVSKKAMKPYVSPAKYLRRAKCLGDLSQRAKLS